MKNTLNDLFYRNSISTAQSIQNKLLSQGIDPSKINQEHVLTAYSKGKILKSRADFNSIQHILPSLTNQRPTLGSKILGLIVETREHPHLYHVIETLIETLKIPVQLYHGSSNLDFIHNCGLSKYIENRLLYLTNLSTNDFNARQNNALLLSIEFWNSLHGRNKILMFQTDSIVCRNSDYSLEDFSSYDYIGSKWPRKRPIGFIIDGGNGGFSLRDWKKSYECLCRFPPHLWPGGEDGYFGFHIDLVGGNIGKNDSCARFSTQFNYSSNSLGAHKISCLSKKNKSKFIKYCKESSFMR